MKVISTKYVGPTNTRGSRIVASDGDNRVTVNYRSEWSDEKNHQSAAYALMVKLGWHGTLQGGHVKNGMVFCFLDEQNQVTV